MYSPPERFVAAIAAAVLAVGGALSSGPGVEDVMRQVADDVTGLVIPGAGHFLPEEAPEAMTRALLDFLG